MRKRSPKGEEGASLVIVLVFITMFGLICAALLTEAGASVKYTSVVNNHEQMTYASDAGVSLGIQQLRQNDEICGAVGAGGPSIPATSVNGKTVSVTCGTTNGSALGGSGYAVITTSTGASSLSFGSGNAKKITGPVYVSGSVSWGPGLELTGGNFYQKNPGTCPTAPTASQLDVDLPYGYYCTTGARPDPPHNPPAMPTAVNPGYVDSGSCRIFYPGKYTSAPSLGGGDNYFVSGVYYFDFNGPLTVKQTTVYGGQPSSTETRKFTPAPTCASSDPSGTIGTGVDWIFGNQSRLDIDTQGKVELFRRAGETGSVTNKISLVGVPNESAWTGLGYVANALPSSTPIISIKDGNPQDMALHGLIYAPNQAVELTATNSVLAQTLGGMVVYSLSMKSSASASGMDISVEAGAPEPRQILITATAQDPNGEQNSISTAVVQVANDGNRTVTVKSWRTRGASDSL